MTISSCEPRSGISQENDNPVCGVTDQSREPIIIETESQMAGQKLFKAYCAKCHEPINSPTKDGFRMEGVCDRIPNEDWFKRFVLNSDSLKKAGDPYSLKLDHDWKYDYEHSFKTLSDKDIEDIHNYLRLR